VPSRLQELFQTHSHYEDDYADVRGQESAKRALVIAAAGAHNLLMLGPRAAAKTMLAKRLPSILPPLTAAESIEATRVYSALGRLPAGQALLARRPFRSPHHTISDAGLVGGGSIPAPGEISLSHHGVLFLDELPEFNRRTLEVLRQPLEDGVVTISRALTSTTFPAEFMLVAALNPCPCGFRTDPRRDCHCTTIQVEKYMSKISGPLLDRIDIHIDVPAVPFKELAGQHAGTGSREMREMVVSARQRQQARFTGTKSRSNAHMASRQIRQHCRLTEDCLSLLKSSVTNWDCQPGPTTRSSAWPAPLPTWTPPKTSSTPTCPRPSNFGCWIASSGRNRTSYKPLPNKALQHYARCMRQANGHRGRSGHKKCSRTLGQSRVNRARYADKTVWV